MPILLLLTLGAGLVYAAYSAGQGAVSTNWPPTTAQQQALQTQISQLVTEVTGNQLSAQQQQNLTNLLANAPTQYQATLPVGTAATFAGYQAWVLAGSAAQAASVANQQYNNGQQGQGQYGQQGSQLGQGDGS
jgi:hypothetical protein